MGCSEKKSTKVQLIMLGCHLRSENDEFIFLTLDQDLPLKQYFVSFNEMEIAYISGLSAM